MPKLRWAPKQADLRQSASSHGKVARAMTWLFVQRVDISIRQTLRLNGLQRKMRKP